MEQENEKKNINLMPEDLRSFELDHLDKKKIDTSHSMMRPDHDSLRKGKSAKETGSHPSIFSKLKNIFPKSDKMPKAVPPSEPLLKKLSKDLALDEDFSLDPTVMPASKQSNDISKPSTSKIVMPQSAQSEVRAALERPPVDLPSKPESKEPVAMMDDGEGDFTIPTPELSGEKTAPKSEMTVGESKSSEEEKDRFGLKFHKPSGRIRAKFLDQEGVDLIPTAARIRSWQQVVNIIILTLIGSVIVIAVFWGALFVQEQTILDQQDKREMTLSGLEQQIVQYEQVNKDIDNLGSQIELINSKLNSHVYWTKFFSLLEKYTAQEVRFQGISVGINGGLTLEATGPSFESVARQLKAFQQESAKEFVTDVSITSASENEAGVQFSIIMVLNPDLFFKTVAQ